MTKPEMVKQILQKLLDSNKSIGYYHKEEIEKAIMESRGVLDQRAINNWFAYLWKLDYFTQPKQGIYNLNLAKIQELELPLPFQIDPKQRRLL
jgi:hypothetical protein